MNNKGLFVIATSFIIGCILIGGFLGIYLIGKATGEYPVEFIWPMITGITIGIIVYLLLHKWNKMRNGKIPEFDERSALLMKRYFMFVLYVILFGSGAVLLVLYSMGVQAIETGMLIVCLLFLYMLIAVGAFITKRL